MTIFAELRSKYNAQQMHKNKSSTSSAETARNHLKYRAIWSYLSLLEFRMIPKNWLKSRLFILLYLIVLLTWAMTFQSISLGYVKGSRLYLHLAAWDDLKTNNGSVCEAEVFFRSLGALQQISGKHGMPSYSLKRPAQPLNVLYESWLSWKVTLYVNKVARLFSPTCSISEQTTEKPVGDKSIPWNHLKQNVATR